MRRLGCLLAAAVAGTLAAQAPVEIERQLDEVARVASVMVDGEACRRIVTARALGSIARVNPRDQWAAADNYEVEHAPYIQVKKSLMRLARLAPFPCDVNLWMPLPGGRIHVVIRNQNELSQFWTWGALHQEMFPPMKEVLDSGKRITVKQKPGFISVLAPVTDSLGDVVGLVEVVTQSRPDPHANVK